MLGVVTPVHPLSLGILISLLFCSPRPFVCSRTVPDQYVLLDQYDHGVMLVRTIEIGPDKYSPQQNLGHIGPKRVILVQSEMPNTRLSST